MAMAEIPGGKRRITFRFRRLFPPASSLWVDEEKRVRSSLSPVLLVRDCRPREDLREKCTPMKLVPLLLGASLAANAAMLVFFPRPASSSSKSEPASTLNPNSTHAHSSASGESEGQFATADRQPASKSVSWSTLGDADLPDMVARLRAAGFPPAAIRGIISARLSDEMAARRKELLKGLEDPPFWKVKRSMFDPKYIAAQREYYQEHTRILKELLGSDAADDNELSGFIRRRQYGDVPASKAEELQRVAADYGELRSSIYAEANGLIMPEDRDKIAYLEREMRNDLAEILTPLELENYELRSSATAAGLRSQLTTFQPTEAEFRALFHAARGIDEKYGSNQSGMTIDQRLQRTAALNEQAKLALSAERFAQFEQAVDPAYSMLNRVVARYELPETVVPQVAAAQKDFQQRAAALRQRPAAEQAAMAQALQLEATNTLKPLLGDQAFEAYKVYGGQWLDQITRAVPRGRPQNPPGTPPASAPKG